MERIGDEVERTLSRSGGGARALAVTEVVTVWPSAVGDVVARHAWPLRLARDGTLHVATSSSTWAFELDRLAPEILEKLASHLQGEPPAALRLRPGPVPEPGAAATATPPEPPPDLPPEVVADVASAASAIEDPELRELVARAARASLGRARSGRPI